MRTALRSLIAIAATGLALAPAASADTATADLALARDACGAAGAPRLSFDYGAAVGCGNVFNFTGDVAPVAYPAEAAALPLTVDAARSVHVEITSGNFLGDSPRGPIGDETTTISLTGKKKGSNSLLTLFETSKTTAAADRLTSNEQTVIFDLPLQAAHAGQYKSLELSVSVTGSLPGGYISHGGASFMSLPVLDGTLPAPVE
jgi:hypothetical protein